MPKKGYKQPAEVRARQSLTRRGRVQSSEHVANRVASLLKTRANWNPERLEREREHLRIVAKTRNSIGVANSNYRGGMFKPCDVCSTDTWVVASRVSRATHYCGKECERKGKIKVLSEVDLVRRTLHSRMARMINYEIGRAKAGRSWQALTGYTVEALRAHLESLFAPGMTWKNRAAWHIDHVIPKSSYVFTSAEDQAFKDCWALSNLQPLWAVDNLRKGARFQPASATVAA